MKLTPTQARIKIRQELNKGHGIYIDGRYFDTRVKAGVLQVSDFNSWFDVKPGSEFRNGHGRALFTYEPEQNYKRLIVETTKKAVSSQFVPGADMEVIRESGSYYFISPYDVEMRVSKATMQVTGRGLAHGVKFKAFEAGI